MNALLCRLRQLLPRNQWQARLLPILALLAANTLLAQVPPTWPENGVRDERSGWHAFENATIITAPGQRLEKATLLIHNGLVEAVGTKVSIPPQAVRHDASGEVIAPAFLDPWTDFGMPEMEERDRESRQEQLVSERPGAWAWNEALHPEFDAAHHFTADEDAAKAWREAGFGAVVTHRQDGIARGSGAVTLTLGEGREHDAIVQERSGAYYSFRKGNSPQPYPSSLMGSIALLRQTHLDAQWYAQQSSPRDEVNLSLEAWNKLQELPAFFYVEGPFDALRAKRLADEFGLTYTYRGDGTEYRRMDAVKGLAQAMIIPMNFPEPYDVSDPLDAYLIDYPDMLHWEWAPANAARLLEAGVSVAFTTDGLESPADLWDAVREAIKHGLSEKDALAALTTVPAKMAGVDAELGRLAPGMRANFIRCTGDVFNEKTVLLETWVGGEGFRHTWPDASDRSGVYRLMGGGDTITIIDPDYTEYQEALPGFGSAYRLTIGGTTAEPAISLQRAGEDVELTSSTDRDRISLSFSAAERTYRLSGWWLDGKMGGLGQDDQGAWFNWRAERQGNAPDSTEEAIEIPGPPVMAPIPYPFQAFGRTAEPTQENVVFRNATVWTNGADGILEQADVWVREGRIEAVGSDLKAKGAREVDASGMHLTSGIIDEHSHIAIKRGVNEGTQASSAEVRIGDVVDSEDIDIYRQLSGGVTAAQLLHGSANPIGGQSALVKLRWGALPEDMKIAGADGFIKFALGENVKQSNWGDDNRVRFPQTRMGVEQVFEDHFTRAAEYGKRLDAGDPTLRRDLDLEAVLEILRSERFVTCHSYVQSEINMLMKVAERHDFRINTFTHILEGYKVADKMAEHGAGGSTFADWWAYKFEVNDAIPYNAALMHRMGVVTAINSDDAEMGRRLNQQAAKAVKYGGVSEEEAWKMVTLNAAKLLHLDGRMGSVEAGKDADIVLWTDNPLSIYAIADQTWIDGRMYYSRKSDRAARTALAQDRQRLLDRMMAAAEAGADTKAPDASEEHNYHCDDMHAE